MIFIQGKPFLMPSQQAANQWRSYLQGESFMFIRGRDGGRSRPPFVFAPANSVMAAQNSGYTPLQQIETWRTLYGKTTMECMN